MNSKEIVLHLMKEQDETNGSFAAKLGVKATALWDRFYGKNKAKDVTIPLFIEMLRVLGYKLVVVPKDAKVLSGEYLVTTSSPKVNPNEPVGEDNA